MPRLKNPQEVPPHGWQYLQVHISPGAPITGHSMRDLAIKLQQLRLGNPGISAQYNLSTDINVIENEINEQNAQRCLSHGWSAFVEDSVGPPQPVFHQPQRLPRVAAAATSVKRAAVGVATIRDWWLGDSLKPVAPELAEKRAQVCVVCPKNGNPNLVERLTGEAASILKGLIQAREDMELKTSVDDKLHTCTCCGCNLGLKVWVDSAYLLKNVKAEDINSMKAVVLQKDGLTPMKCWVIEETAK